MKWVVYLKYGDEPSPFHFLSCTENLPERGVLPPHPRFRLVARNGAFFVVLVGHFGCRGRYKICPVIWLTFLKSKSPRGDRAQDRQSTTNHHDGRSVGAAARRRVLVNSNTLSICATRTVFVELRLPVGKFALFNRVSHFLHNDLIEMQIVNGVELCAQNFACFVQMV